MVNNHLSEEEVQEYALNSSACDATIAAHILLCDACKIRTENYMVLFTGIKQQPEPEFGFDLAETLLKQLPLLKTKTSYEKILIWSIVFFCIVFICTGLYFFREYFKYLFDGIKTIVIILIAVTALTVLVGLFIDMYKKYREEMNLLDFN